MELGSRHAGNTVTLESGQIVEVAPLWERLQARFVDILPIIIYSYFVSNTPFLYGGESILLRHQVDLVTYQY